MKRKEKAPSERTLGKGANNKIQHDPITEYLKSQGQLAKRGILGLCRLAQVLNIEVKSGKINIQFTEDDFRRLFGEQQRKSYIEDFDYMFTQQDEVEFFCLAERRK